MIIPSYTEDEVLRELLEDWPEMRRKAKKMGDKLMKSIPKWCIGMPKDERFYSHATFRSKNGNTWGIGVYKKNTKKYWESVLTCEVETKYGVKSYFYLRGLEKNEPYYVELTSHAISRLRERATLIGMDQIVNISVKIICDIAIFDKGERGVFLKKGTIDENGNFIPALDHDGNTYGRVWLHDTIFFARATKHGNYILKTYINPAPLKKIESRKNEYDRIHSGLWILLNRDRLDSDYVKMYKDMTQEQIAKAFISSCPNMYDEIQNLEKSLLVLHP